MIPHSQGESFPCFLCGTTCRDCDDFACHLADNHHLDTDNAFDMAFRYGTALSRAVQGERAIITTATLKPSSAADVKLPDVPDDCEYTTYGIHVRFGGEGGCHV